MECPIAKSLWNKFTKWYNATCRGNIALEQNEIVYGVLKFTSSGLTLNHLIIIGKYFLCINAVQDDKSQKQFELDFAEARNEIQRNKAFNKFSPRGTDKFIFKRHSFPKFNFSRPSC